MTDLLTEGESGRRYDSDRLSDLESRLAGQILSLPVNSRAEKYLNGPGRRAFDVVVASVLLFALIPLFCLIAIAIRLTSPGPLLFKQWRHGRGMVQFQL